MRRWFAVLALGAVVAACSEQTTSPRPRTPAVAADFTNNLDNGNPRIIRFGESWWWVYFEDGPYQAWHVSEPGVVGLDPAQCWDGTYYLTDEQLVAHNQVEWWNGLVNAHDLGTIWVVVYDTSKPGPCHGHAVVGMGPATLKVQTNDYMVAFYGYDVGADRAVSVSFEAEGVLTTPAGGTVRYNGHLHFVTDRAGNWKSSSEQIVVH